MFPQHVCVTIFGFLMLLNISCYKYLLCAGFQCPYITNIGFTNVSSTPPCTDIVVLFILFCICYFNCEWKCIGVDMVFFVIESIPYARFNVIYFCLTNRRRTLNNILVSFHSKTTRLLITIAIRVPTVVGSTLEVIGAFRSSTNPHNSSWSTHSLQ